jgi:uncharacterized Zn-finger protein
MVVFGQCIRRCVAIALRVALIPSISPLDCVPDPMVRRSLEPGTLLDQTPYDQDSRPSPATEFLGSGVHQQQYMPADKSISGSDQSYSSSLGVGYEDTSKSRFTHEHNTILNPGVKLEPGTLDFLSPELCGSAHSGSSYMQSDNPFTTPAFVSARRENPFQTPVSVSAGKELVVDGADGPNYPHHSAMPSSLMAEVHAPNPKLDHQPPQDSCGLRRFPCPQCDKQFDYRANQQRHLLIHSGAKPHKCDVCGFACNHKSNLKKHMLIHTGCKPCRCHLCPKSFTQKSHLQNHLQTHRNVNS